MGAARSIQVTDRNNEQVVYRANLLTLGHWYNLYEILAARTVGIDRLESMNPIARRQYVCEQFGFCTPIFQRFVSSGVGTIYIVAQIFGISPDDAAWLAMCPEKDHVIDCIKEIVKESLPR